MEERFHDIVLPDEMITDKICLIRGKKVILDRDLAMLYKIETKVLKQAVRRNSERFPDDFMFELTNELIIKQKDQEKRRSIGFKRQSVEKDPEPLTGKPFTLDP